MARTHDSRFDFLRADCAYCIGCGQKEPSHLTPTGACPFFMSSEADRIERKKQCKRFNPYKCTSANDWCKSGEAKRL